MKIRVELFGIPRLRAGVSQTVVTGETLGEVFSDLARKFPELGEACIVDQSLKAGFTANLSGQRFVTDPTIRLKNGDTVLLLSMDAGG